MKDNCFTEFCWFLPNINMNQPNTMLLKHFSGSPLPSQFKPREPCAINWALPSYPSPLLSPHLCRCFSFYLSHLCNPLPTTYPRVILQLLAYMSFCPGSFFWPPPQTLVLTTHPPFPLENCSVNSVLSLSGVQLFVTPWTTACQASLFITNSQSPSKPMSIESVMPSNHFISVIPFSCPQSLITCKLFAYFPYIRSS